jgi:hypothetical protein
MSQESIHFFMSTVSTSKHKKGVIHRTHSNDPDNDVGANSYVSFLCLQHNARMYLGKEGGLHHSSKSECHKCIETHRSSSMRDCVIRISWHV